MKVSMKRVLLGSVVSAGVVAGGAMVAQAASTNSSTSAQIIAALAIVNTQGLEFASIVPSGSSDTVIVSPVSVRTCGATLTCTGSVFASAFDVTGGNNLTYSITLPGAAATLTSGANSMTVDNFIDSGSGTGTLSALGSQTFTVGGTLNVGINQPAGVYAGSYSVTVDYN